jgi:drug/metabolite transporter (DMT)-like permease
VARSGNAVQAVIFTILALVCFAANSIFCRLAFASHSIDPASFTAIRVLSGAVMVSLIVLASGKNPTKAGNWISGGLLFVYAIAFSLAYIKLGAGTGALILFGAVQVTMIVGSMFAKKSPTPLQWIGLAAALGGLIYLLMPGLSAPPLDRALLMALAGSAWGIYSIRGPGGSDPVSATAGNFLRALPLAVIPFALLFKDAHFSDHGVLLAVASGAITSGLGYVFWYTALPHLGAIRAAIVQLTVPILAAAGGILLLGETLKMRLLISGAIVLAGVAVSVVGKKGK